MVSRLIGQTGSGKTYTMQGPSSTPSEADRGVILRVANQIVQHIAQASRGSSSTTPIEFTVRASYLEIYQEQLKDLLCHPDEQGELRIRMDPTSTTGRDLFVEGLTERTMLSWNDYVKMVEIGSRNRTVAETKYVDIDHCSAEYDGFMNEVSSRSHAVLTLTIEQFQIIPSSMGGQSTVGDGLGSKKRSKIHLIDLAGSERADSTGATGTRLKEGSAINQSLSCLGNVINALSSNMPHIPYRDSKLTYLLSDSLGGNSLTVLLACITPIASAYEETLSTLRFAERAKKVTNKARLNLDPATQRILALEAEIARLRAMLAQCTCGANK
eukprot:jgi/Hompol1/1742/HPOL_001457-RA